MDQAVLQIVLKDVITDRTDDDAHTEQTGCSDEQYPFLDSAYGKPDILFQSVRRFRDDNRTFPQFTGEALPRAFS